MRVHFIWLQLFIHFTLVMQAADRPIRTYVASLGENSCTLAWGRLDGGDANWVGRSARGIGEVTIRMGNQTRTTTQSWIRLEGLSADTTYDYSLSVGATPFARGRIRTWPARATRLSYLVIGDWGNGSALQYTLARRMEEERIRRESSDSPIRFVMSTGDNIYAGGSRDRDWDSKFFQPYEATLKSIPFYAVAGNHDGNESERGKDLEVYLDNFFGPDGEMSRWYRFQFGGLAEFFALDSTTNQYPGPKSPAYAAGGAQSEWFGQALRQPAAGWRIAFFHHPMFTAGPKHPPALPNLTHWFDAMREGSVSAVFSGHEHNLQFSGQGAATGGMQFVLSGAGGELRRGNVKAKMNERHIGAWAPQAHFLLVEIEGDQMKITPVSDQPLRLVNSSGEPVATPILVNRRRP